MFSGAAAVLVAVGFVGMLTPALHSIRGLSQRCAEFRIFGWIAATSVFLLREKGGQTSR
jgi:hypothetical protein